MIASSNVFPSHSWSRSWNSSNLWKINL